MENESRRWQVEDSRGVIEAHHTTEQEALDHAKRLKRTSHRNRPVVVSTYITGKKEEEYKIKYRF
jgi:hypothetical protein